MIGEGAAARQVLMRTLFGFPIKMFPAARLLAAFALLLTAVGCRSAVPGPLHFEIRHAPPDGHGVYVVGNHPLLGSGDTTRAVRLVPAENDVWSLDIRFPPQTPVEWAYLTRDDRSALADDPGNANLLPAPANSVVTGGRARKPSPGQVPATPVLSPPRVIKTTTPAGSLSERPLYIYLPRGYEQHSDATYPVILMHDGQNCFQEFAADSFAGSWKADTTATRLIDEGRMRPCIVVGVANGQAMRLREYMPPWACYSAECGEGDAVLGYYFGELLPWLRANYRVAEGRENVATVGSSLGGLMAIYAAHEHSAAAKHHAALSPALWITRESEEYPEPLVFERYAEGPKPDVRLWIDSGSRSSFGSTDSDDDMANTLRMRDVLIGNGFLMGDDLMHIVDPGGTHNESSWAARLDRVFEFLFPAD